MYVWIFACIYAIHLATMYACACIYVQYINCLNSYHSIYCGNGWKLGCFGFFSLPFLLVVGVCIAFSIVTIVIVVRGEVATIYFLFIYRNS